MDTSPNGCWPGMSWSDLAGVLRAQRRSLPPPRTGTGAMFTARDVNHGRVRRAMAKCAKEARGATVTGRLWDDPAPPPPRGPETLVRRWLVRGYYRKDKLPDGWPPERPVERVAVGDAQLDVVLRGFEHNPDFARTPVRLVS